MSGTTGRGRCEERTYGVQRGNSPLLVAALLRPARIKLNFSISILTWDNVQIYNSTLIVQRMRRLAMMRGAAGGAHLGAVFAEVQVADPVQLVLDAPSGRG
jgi:hypothetical protein